MKSVRAFLNQRAPVWLRLTALLLLVCLIPAPTSADIASFNKAIQAGDFKKAAWEAAETWPTLDQTRPDLGVIANEFSFASFLAEEYGQTRKFAQLALAHSTDSPADRSLQVSANILNDAADLKITKKRSARDTLYAALEPRLSLPGVDMVAYLGASTLVNYDLEDGRIKDAVDSARLGASLMKAGGESYQVQFRRFELYEQIATHGRRPTVSGLKDFNAVVQAITDDIGRSSTDESGEALVPLYWQAYAWSEAIRSYLLSDDTPPGYVRDSRITRDRDKDLDDCDCDREPSFSQRARKILGTGGGQEGCETKAHFASPIRFPTSQLYRGRIGSVVVAVNVDKTGAVSNERVLAAVPEAHFSEAVLSKIPSTTIRPEDGWDDAQCTLENDQYVIVVNFVIG